MAWHNSFGHWHAQSAFFGQNDQNTPSQTWVDQMSNKIKILTKKTFFMVLYQTRAPRRFLATLTQS